MKPPDAARCAQGLQTALYGGAGDFQRVHQRPHGIYPFSVLFQMRQHLKLISRNFHKSTLFSCRSSSVPPSYPDGIFPPLYLHFKEIATMDSCSRTHRPGKRSNLKKHNHHTRLLAGYGGFLQHDSNNQKSIMPRTFSPSLRNSSPSTRNITCRILPLPPRMAKREPT